MQTHAQQHHHKTCHHSPNILYFTSPQTHAFTPLKIPFAVAYIHMHPENILAVSSHSHFQLSTTFPSYFITYIPPSLFQSHAPIIIHSLLAAIFPLSFLHSPINKHPTLLKMHSLFHKNFSHKHQATNPLLPWVLFISSIISFYFHHFPTLQTTPHPFP